jgi:hypothetical protein
MFEIEVGDIVEVIKTEYEVWNGLVGVAEMCMPWKGFRVRFTEEVPRRPHDDPYILQLSTNNLRLVSSREPDWEV